MKKAKSRGKKMTPKLREKIQSKIHSSHWKSSDTAEQPYSGQNILNKIYKSSKTREEKKSLRSTFACFLTAIAKV